MQKFVELVEHDAGFDHDRLLLRIEFTDAREITRTVENQIIAQRLAIGAGAAAARGEGKPVSALRLHAAHDAVDVIAFGGIKNGQRRHLINAVVGGRDDARGVIGFDIAAKTAGLDGVDQRRQRVGGDSVQSCACKRC